MGPFTNSLLAGFFILFAFSCLLSMLESWGNEQTRFRNRGLCIFHRTSGYLFILVYLAMIYIMLKRFSMMGEPLTAIPSIHVILAVSIFPVLMVKILIIRRFKALQNFLPVFGIVLFTFALSLNVVTAGFFLLRSSNVRFISLISYDKKVLDPDLGRALLDRKCIKCHTLERIFSTARTQAGWTKTVNSMVFKDPTIMRDDAAQIINYLVAERSVRNVKGRILSGMRLTDQKCGRCHALKEVYQNRRAQADWETIVNNMAGIEPEWITEDDKAAIKEYLITRHSSTKTKEEPRFGTDVTEKSVAGLYPPGALGPVIHFPPGTSGETIFKVRCRACHSDGRIYKKAQEIGGDATRWRELVNEMIDKGAEVQDSEIEIIVAYLNTLKR